MAKTRSGSIERPVKPSRPALSPEAREMQMIAKAVNLAERQLEDGTASSQVITHFLKLGTEKYRLEREKLARETELLKAKTELTQSTKRIEELYENALRAMKNYQGQEDYDDYEI